MRIILSIILLILIIISICLLISGIKKEPVDNAINKHIGHIYYINLDKRKDRKKEFEYEMIKMEIDRGRVTRVSGVLDEDNGHKGCCASHIAALEAAIKNGYKNVLICEDDFAFRRDYNSTNMLINKAFEDLRNDYDVIMLVLNPCKTEIEGYSCMKRVKCAATAAGYIVNKRYYEKLLNLYKKCHRKMKKKLKKSKDEFWAHDQKWKSLQKNDKWYTIVPKIGRIRHGYSDIMKADYKYDL